MLTFINFFFDVQEHPTTFCIYTNPLHTVIWFLFLFLIATQLPNPYSKIYLPKQQWSEIKLTLKHTFMDTLCHGPWFWPNLEDSLAYIICKSWLKLWILLLIYAPIFLFFDVQEHPTTFWTNINVLHTVIQFDIK